MQSQRNWTPAENEFFAENSEITIIPSFKGEQFNFISGSYGPFRPSRPMQVPLWLAVYLKQRNKCDVQVPNWLDIEFLKKVRAEERSEAFNDKFSEVIPFYYFEIGRLLLTECKTNFERPQEVTSILEDIKEIRKEKMLRNMKTIDPDTPVQYLSHVGAQEISQLRPVLQEAYGTLN